MQLIVAYTKTKVETVMGEILDLLLHCVNCEEKHKQNNFKACH